MIITKESIKRHINNEFLCSYFDEEFIKIQTPYLYSDNDVIDIFVKSQESGFILTDLGETIGKLITQSMSNSLTQKDDESIKNLIVAYQVERYKGMLIKRCENAENLLNRVIDLCRAITEVNNTC